jgi:uncharacterized protein YwqG
VPSIVEIRNKLQRRAIILEPAIREKGFVDPSWSWFGKVDLCLPGETWPMHDDEPLSPLMQINLTKFPFRPPHLSDVELIAVFINEVDLPTSDEANGNGWCLRAYPSISKLVPLVAPDSLESDIKAFPLKPAIIEVDFPCHEDVDIDLPEELDDNYADHFKTVEGHKLGGWPFLIQSEIYWAPWNKHPAKPEYVFQIDSCEKGQWQWGDSGVGYFGRGTEPGHENVWTLSWQCF